MLQTDWLLAVNAGTLLAVLGFGYRILRFINRIEFKTDLMWVDYEARIVAARIDERNAHARANSHVGG